MNEPLDLDLLLARVRVARAELALAEALNATLPDIPVAPATTPEDDFSDLLMPLPERRPAYRRWRPPARHMMTWTPEEDAILHDMTLSVEQKAVRLGRTLRAIEMRMESHGLSEQAEDNFDDLLAERPEDFDDLLAEIPVEPTTPPENKNRAGLLWTEEDFVVVRDPTLSPEQKAERLGRSLAAVYSAMTRQGVPRAVARGSTHTSTAHAWPGGKRTRKPYSPEQDKILFGHEGRLDMLAVEWGRTEGALTARRTVVRNAYNHKLSALRRGEDV